MNFWDILAGMLVLLSVAFALGIFFERIGQSAVLGYLLAGLILGPNALGVAAEQEEVVRGFAELGVALLLFAIGLEFSFKKLWRIGPVGLGGGAIQVGLTVVLAGTASWFFGLSPKAAIAVGAIAAFSSTACVLRVLTDRAQIDSVHGRNALGILLLQDMAVVPLVLIVSMLNTEAVDATGLAWEMGKSIFVFAAMSFGFWAAANFILPRILRTSALVSNRELLILLAVVISMGSAWTAHAVGLSPALGAFVAGLVMAESPYALQARADVAPLRTLFVTLFFVSMGMLGDVGWVIDHAWEVFLTGTALIGGKTLLVAAIVRSFRHPWPESVATAACLAQIGEFSYIIATLAFLQSSDPGDQYLFKLFVSVMLVSLLVTPYMVTLAPRLGHLAGKWLGKTSGRIQSETTKSETGPGIIVVGYGVAGQRLVESLERHDVPITVVDFRHANVDLAIDRGHGAVVGDARNPELLELLEVSHARMVIVAIPDHLMTINIIHQVRVQAPNVPVVVRARYHRHVDEIESAGATVVVDEEIQIGRRLAVTAGHLLMHPSDGVSDVQAPPEVPSDGPPDEPEGP
ncbi:MAG: cation:proton antiporter [Phycisphaeraceae bacterium]|nr:cation:proton antiporter [Phycisphaeraceae bacterium]